MFAWRFKITIGKEQNESSWTKKKGRETRASRASALYRAGLRPSPHPASGSTSLREASRKGAFLTSDRLTPCIHQSGASCPTPFLHTKRGETGVKNPRITEIPSSWFPSLRSRRFPTRKPSWRGPWRMAFASGRSGEDGGGCCGGGLSVVGVVA